MPRPGLLMTLLLGLARFLIALASFTLAGLAVLALLGFAVAEFDLINHFQFMLFGLTVITAILSLAALRRTRWKGPVIVAAFTGLIASGVTFVPELIAGLMPHRPQPTDGRPVIRVMTHNLFGLNYEMERVLAVIADEQPDIIALQEYFPEQSSELGPLLRQDYPHVVQCRGGKRANIAIYAKLPFEEAEDPGDCPPDAYGSQRTARILANFEVEGSRFAVLTTHLDWPVPVGRQTSQFAELTEATLAVGGPLLVVGDFNSTPWSYAFRDFAMRSLLERHTRNIVTYPLRFAAPRRFFPEGLMRTLPVLPLDHVLSRNGIAVHAVHAGADTGSDHLPVIVTFSVGTN